MAMALTVKSRRVLAEGTGEGHRLRAAVVQVNAIAAEGGHLHAFAAANGDGAVFQARGQGVGGEQRQNLPRLRAGGNVPVPRLQAQQGIAHRAAYAPRFMARALQAVQDFFYMFRQLDHQRHPIFCGNFSFPVIFR